MKNELLPGITKTIVVGISSADNVTPGEIKGIAQMLQEKFGIDDVVVGRTEGRSSVRVLEAGDDGTEPISIDFNLDF